MAVSVVNVVVIFGVEAVAVYAAITEPLLETTSTRPQTLNPASVRGRSLTGETRKPALRAPRRQPQARFRVEGLGWCVIRFGGSEIYPWGFGIHRGLRSPARKTLGPKFNGSGFKT